MQVRHADLQSKCLQSNCISRFFHAQEILTLQIEEEASGSFIFTDCYGQKEARWLSSKLA